MNIKKQNKINILKMEQNKRKKYKSNHITTRYCKGNKLIDT